MTAEDPDRRFTPENRFPAVSHEAALDKLILAAQEKSGSKTGSATSQGRPAASAAANKRKAKASSALVAIISTSLLLAFTSKLAMRGSCHACTAVRPHRAPTSCATNILSTFSSAHSRLISSRVTGASSGWLFTLLSIGVVRTFTMAGRAGARKRARLGGAA